MEAVDAQARVRGVVQPSLLPPAAGGVCVHLASCDAGAAVVSFHPDVAVVLGHAGLGVQEWQADAAFSTQAGIVAAALLNGLLIELVAQPEGGVTSGQ